MRLKELVLKNFRAFQDEIRVTFNDLTAFIGKNDAGKSTILEALEIFFNGLNGPLVKVDSSDANIHSEDKHVIIGCVFTNLPEQLVLDSQTFTSLADENLLNINGDMEIHKIIDCNLKSPKETIVAFALHPTAVLAKDLLELTNSELKKRAEQVGVDMSTVDKRSNPALRSAIRSCFDDLGLEQGYVQLSKQDAKKMWDAIEQLLPRYALFQADRPSKDEDSEIQDPMKLAVIEAIKSVEETLNEVKEVVRMQVTEVASRTLEKLKEMDPLLATELSPHFKAEPRWDGLFKLSLTGDDQIPINKRGSGVRRLILLNFFRAEAERKQRLSGDPGIVYGIEEPETAQHPSNQTMIVSSLTALSEQENSQVVLTTHVPGLAGFLETSSLRYIYVYTNGTRRVQNGDDTVYQEIATQLGMLPDSRVRLFICVEGPHDVRFLKHISSMLHDRHSHVLNLANDPRVVLLHLGGSTLKEWVQDHYLRGLGKPEVHIYDRDDGTAPKYQAQYDAVNARRDGSIAFITGKREMENYLHPDAIAEVFGFSIAFGDMDDVPEMVAKLVHEMSGSSIAWADLDEEKRKKKISKAKSRLNNDVAARMSPERLHESDPNGDIEKWLGTIIATLNRREMMEETAPTVE